MAFPSSQHPASHPSLTPHGPAGGVVNRQAGATPRCNGQQDLQAEGEHQLEKLEFALAVALTRGDAQRSALLRDQIAALGGNHEEPGT